MLRDETARPSRPAGPYDIITSVPPGTDPAPYIAAGATWLLVVPPWEAVSATDLRSVIHDGPMTG
jgi:hypothetical protein